MNAQTPFLDAQYEELGRMEARRAGIQQRLGVMNAVLKLCQSPYWADFIESLEKLQATTMKTMIQTSCSDAERRECAAEARCWQWIIERPKFASQVPAMETQLEELTGEISKLAKILPERG